MAFNAIAADGDLALVGAGIVVDLIAVIAGFIAFSLHQTVTASCEPALIGAIVSAITCFKVWVVGAEAESDDTITAARLAAVVEAGICSVCVAIVTGFELR